MAHELRLVVMEGLFADYPAKFRAALDRLGIAGEIQTFPHVYTRELTRAKVREIRALLQRRSIDEILFFFPGALEIYFNEPDMSFHCSAYRSWFDPRRMMVIPHPWTPLRRPNNREHLCWQEKPELKIGFMGSTYRTSRGARIGATLPASIKRWIAKGWVRRDADRIGWLYEHGLPIHYIAAFPRIEVLDEVERAAARDSGDRIEIIETAGFDGSEARLADFADHLQRTTYELCPRGCENFSFRLFETLRFGRVPVIIDTDMVLPSVIDWEKIAVIVDGSAPDSVYDRIVGDYSGMSEEQFLARQKAIFEASETIDGECWLADGLRAALERALGADCSMAQTAAKARHLNGRE